MGKFWQMSTELLPFMLKIGFHALSWAVFDHFSSNYIKKEWHGIAYRLILPNNYRVMALDLNFEQS